MSPAATTEPPEEEEAEKKKAKKTKKDKGRTDEELFGHTGDIFADVPDSVPKKITKKKKKAAAGAKGDETPAGGENALAVWAFVM